MEKAPKGHKQMGATQLQRARIAIFQQDIL